jgi:hypothetical protein
MMFGIAEMPASPETGRFGCVWALGTDYITTHPKQLQRCTKKILPLLSAGYAYIGGAIDSLNERHIRWLLKSGFYFPGTYILSGPASSRFDLFYKETDV